MNAISMIVSLFGGLGLFLYGMSIMGDGLENAAGERLKGFFEKLTSNPIKGVLTGTVVTGIIQSSSATTVMVVGFVNAGLMNLYQAASVIMGANIGTTVTAQLISFDIGAIVPLFLGMGGIVCLFSKRDKVRQIATIVLGFGILFLGMDLMTESMRPLSNSNVFINFIDILKQHWVLGLLTGLVMTAIVQSSSATTGIVITLASTGLIDLNIAVPIIFGCNIGTCVTALISSIGTSNTAKRAALIHLLFNVIGTIIFIPLMGILINIVTVITPEGASLAKRQIANAHTIFNVFNTLLLLPAITILVEIVKKIIPGDDEKENKLSTKHLDDRLLGTPAIAISQVNKEIFRMSGEVKDSLNNSMKAFTEFNYDFVKIVQDKEKIINFLENEITKYLVKISKLELLDDETDRVTSSFHIINDLERIGDHADNISELAGELINKNLRFSNDAYEEVKDMYDLVLEAYKLSIESLVELDKSKANKVIEMEENIDRLEKELRGNHIKRLNNGMCDATIGAIFLDLISNLERVGDHATNIAEVTLDL